MKEHDASLLSDARHGDTKALRMLLESHGETVWSTIDRDIATKWRSMIDADDVMQVTYMEAFLQIERLSAKDPESFRAWLRRIAQNNLRDAIRELERLKRPHPDRRMHRPAGNDSYVTLIEVLGSSGVTPSRAVAAAEAAAVIQAALTQLPPDYARVITLYDLESLEIADVAEQLGRSPGAVHMLRVRAHDRLRACLLQESDFFTKTA